MKLYGATMTNTLVSWAPVGIPMPRIILALRPRVSSHDVKHWKLPRVYKQLHALFVVLASVDEGPLLLLAPQFKTCTPIPETITSQAVKPLGPTSHRRS